MITLDNTELPEDLIWIDEFDWTPAEQRTTYTLTGALIVETGIKQTGRAITLVGGPDAAWITRATLTALYNKLSVTASMTLTLNDGRIFNVVFNHSQKPIEAAPIIDYATPDNADWYSLTLRLMQV